jgi:two-component SAPR family response regulator
LESIGKSLGITRERVRQIEEVGFNFVRKNHQPTLDMIFKEFEEYFAKKGGFKKEEIILRELGGGDKNKAYVLFFLILGSQFLRVCEKKDYYYFWSTMPEPEKKVKETLNALAEDLKKHGNPLHQKDLHAMFAGKYGFDDQMLVSYLEVSKRIQANKEGKLGLIEWPEIISEIIPSNAIRIYIEHIGNGRVIEIK